jgi:hypothetical protein
MSGGKRLLGRIAGEPTMNGEVAKEAPPLDALAGALAAAVQDGDVFCIEDAYEFVTSLVPVQGPGGQTAMQRVVQCMPPDNGLCPATIYAKIEGFRLLDGMQEADKNEHKDLVRQVINQTRQARMQRLGIVSGAAVDLKKIMSNMKGKPE